MDIAKHRLEFGDGQGDMKYEIKTIHNNIVSTKELERGQLPSFYYLVS